jgi:hypothetical protein
MVKFAQVLLLALLSQEETQATPKHRSDSVGLCSNLQSEATPPAFRNGFCPAFTKAIHRQSHKQRLIQPRRLFIANPPDMEGTLTIQSKHINTGRWVSIPFQLSKPQMSAREMERAGKEAAADLIPSPPRNKFWRIFRLIP